MAYTRESIREAVERAGDEHWQALIAHHVDAYPASRPTPGDVYRLEAESIASPWQSALPTVRRGRWDQWGYSVRS